MTEKNKPDWEMIEQSYRTGLMSVREMASLAGVSEGAIRKRAKTQGWERDLSKKINAKADALVRTQEVRTQVRTEKVVSERVLIEVSAQAIANVRMSHRGDIRKSRDLVMALLDQLQHETVGIELFEQLGELLRDEDEKGQDKLNDLYHKVISLPSRVKSMKDLADAMKTLIGLEREAYGIGVDPQGKDGSKDQSEAELDRRIAELERKAGH